MVDKTLRFARDKNCETHSQTETEANCCELNQRKRRNLVLLSFSVFQWKYSGRAIAIELCRKIIPSFLFVLLESSFKASASRVPGFKRSISLPAGLYQEFHGIKSLRQTLHYSPAHTPPSEPTSLHSIQQRNKASNVDMHRTNLKSSLGLYTLLQTELYPHLRF